MAEPSPVRSRGSASRPTSRLFGVAALTLGLALGAAGCRKTSEKPDAGLAPVVISDDDLGFRAELPLDWVLQRAGEGGVDAGPVIDAGPVRHVALERLAEARRVPPRGKSFLVPPKLVVTAQPTTAPDTDTVVRATMNDLRGLEQLGARIRRSALATRVVDGVELGDIDLSYEVGDKKESPREIAQRTLVTRRLRKDASPAVWTLTVTYLADDAELVVPEVQHILALLSFQSPDSATGPTGATGSAATAGSGSGADQEGAKAPSGGSR